MENPELYKKNYLMGTVYQHVGYSLIFYALLFNPPIWFKIIAGVMIPVLFYLHIKQDYSIICKLIDRQGKNE